MKTLRFVKCSMCDAIYPKPQPGLCLDCADEDAEWTDWDPRTQNAPSLPQISDIIVGLLMEIDELGKMQDDEGRLSEIVRDALVVVSQWSPEAYADFYLDREA